MRATMFSTLSRGSSAAAAAALRRGIHTTPRLASEYAAPVMAALPARQPVGAFRGGLFGFLVGSALAGAGVYGYLVKEYKASNDLLTEDIYVRYCI
jgi:hypothetical protein